MIYAVFLASLGTIAALVAFLFWQARRAATASDGELASVKYASDIELQLAARGRAIDDRDKSITALEAERDRLRAALAESIAQCESLISNIKDPGAAVDAIHHALSPHPPAPTSVLPDVPKAAPTGATPHR